MILLAEIYFYYFTFKSSNSKQFLELTNGNFKLFVKFTAT